MVIEANTASERFKLKMHDVAPELLIPNGDRYICEEIEMDDNFVMGQILVVTNTGQNAKPGDPMADPAIEKRGVIAAVVVNAGNGHLLGLPDLAPIEQSVGIAYDKDGEEEGAMWQPGDRPWPSVAMFYEPGDIVFIDHNARGRAFKLPGRAIIRVCNQIDILAHLDGVKLERKDDTWVEVE